MAKSEHYSSVSVYYQCSNIIVTIELLLDINSHIIKTFSFLGVHNERTLYITLVNTFLNILCISYSPSVRQYFRAGNQSPHKIE